MDGARKRNFPKEGSQKNLFQLNQFGALDLKLGPSAVSLH